MRKLIYLAAIIFQAFFLSQANALSSAKGQYSEVHLLEDKVSFNQETGEGKGILVINLQDGWKTYAPEVQEVGVTPEINIKDSENIQTVQFLWPEPVTLDEQGTEFKGYKNSVYLPFTFIKNNKDIFSNIKINAKYGVCKNICVLEDLYVDVIVK